MCVFVSHDRFSVIIKSATVMCRFLSVLCGLVLSFTVHSAAGDFTDITFKIEGAAERHSFVFKDAEKKERTLSGPLNPSTYTIRVTGQEFTPTNLAFISTSGEGIHSLCAVFDPYSYGAFGNNASETCTEISKKLRLLLATCRASDDDFGKKLWGKWGKKREQATFIALCIFWTNASGISASTSRSNSVASLPLFRGDKITFDFNYVSKSRIFSSNDDPVS